MAGSYISTVVNRRQYATHFYTSFARINEVSRDWNLLRRRVVFALRSGLFAAHGLSRKFTAAEGGIDAQDVLFEQAFDNALATR